MKIIILSCFILFFVSANIFAQDSIFSEYRLECSKLYNVDVTKPKGFEVIGGLQSSFKVNENINVAWWYSVALESKTKECLILYPFFSRHETSVDLAKGMCYGELKAALNLDPEDRAIVLDSAKYIKIIAKDNMKRYFNADTVFIYSVSLPKPYKDIYKECIGLSLFKQGHPITLIKILLTEEGKKKKDEYMKIIFKTMRYGNIAPEYNQKKIDRTINKMKNKFVFNMKKYSYHSYVGNSNEHRK